MLQPYRRLPLRATLLRSSIAAAACIFVGTSLAVAPASALQGTPEPSPSVAPQSTASPSPSAITAPSTTPAAPPTVLSTATVTPSPTPSAPAIADAGASSDPGHVMGNAGKNAPVKLSSGAGRVSPLNISSEASPEGPSGAFSSRGLSASPTGQPAGTSGMPMGIDVSGWQQNVNWSVQWNNGVRFAYIKASEGTSAMNTYFGQQYNGAADAGMIRGAYHYARPDLSSGANEARVFVNSGGGWSADGRTLPGVLDLEAGTDGTSGYCYGKTPAQLVSWTADFTSTYKALTGRDAGIYTGYYFWQTCLGDSSAFSTSNPLWIAAYGAAANNVWIPGNWPQYTFWQYTSDNGDQNVFNGTSAQLRALAGPAPQLPVVPDAAPRDTTLLTTPVGDFNGDGRPDLITRSPNGTLWFYAGDGNGGYAPASQIGSGWDVFDRIIGSGDFTGDGRKDLVARKLDGTLWLYAGTGVVSSSNEGYRPGVKIGNFGWGAFDSLIAPGDFDGDGRPDLLARMTDGSLWLYPGAGNGSIGVSRQIGTGWNVYDRIIGAGDYNGDGKNDLLARSRDGVLWLYPGTGRVNGTNEGYQARRQVGTGWNVYSDVLGIGDANGDGKPDLQTTSADGTLWFYPGTQMTNDGYAQAERVGDFGWNAFNLLTGVKDFDSDGREDLVARTPGGALWFYPGNGSGGYTAGRQIGTGWNIYTEVVGVGDINGDGRSDLIATKPDGSLWFYAGTGRVQGSDEGYAAGQKIGDFGWDAFNTFVNVGDFDGNGTNDLVARKPDGTLWLFPGTGRAGTAAGGYLPPRRIGDFGWDSFNTLTGVGAFDGVHSTGLVAKKTDGTVWFYAGSGKASLLAGKKIATGWSGVTGWFGGHDGNLDQKPDLAVRKDDGSLWFLAGTGMTDEGYQGRRAAGKL